MANIKKPLIGIIGGKGRMGKIFADFFIDQNLEVIISDKGTTLSNKEVAAKADIVIVSVPIPVTVEVINEITPHLRPDSALTDFTSIKSAPIEAMLRANCEVFGIHPMFGETNSIPGQRVIFCPAREGKWYRWMKNFLTTNEVIIKEMTAVDHDTMMTLVQGLVHFADIAFAHTLRDLKVPTDEFLEFASPPSELKIAFSARILAQDPTLYGAIQIYNEANIKTFKTYLHNIQKLLDIDETKHLGAFTKYFQESADYLSKYKDRAHQETTWIIDQVLENRRKHKLSQSNAKPQPRALPTFDQIATLGPKNTYSDFTARKYSAEINSRQTPFYCKQIKEVFQLVADGKVEQGIVPIENSLNGTVCETLDALYTFDVTIVKVLQTPIHHCIAALEEIDFSHVIAIASHPQAIHQCAKYIQENCPHVEFQYTPSTAAAMHQIMKEKDPRILAIGSKESAESLGLHVIQDTIEDEETNQTNFIVIQKPPVRITLNTSTKTSIIFHFEDGSAPGVLLEALQELGSRGISLTKIESRPQKTAIGDYYFFVEFLGNQNDVNVQAALKALIAKVAKLKILGSY